MRLIRLAVVLFLGLAFAPHLAEAQQAGRVCGGALLRWPQDWGVSEAGYRRALLVSTLIAANASERDPCRRGVPDVYRIGAEDLLRISVWGLTALELGEVLARRIAEYMPSPEVSVIVCPDRFE